MAEHPLDNPAWYALTGPQAGIAERKGDAARYPPEVSPFAGLPAGADAQAWTDLAALTGADGFQALTGPALEPAEGWRLDMDMAGVQMDGSALRVAHDPEALVLGAADAPEMLDLVLRTNPGPFGLRTHELGVYLGFRRGGRLVAMAGERMRPPGWTEISGVCTDPEFRGQGLAGRLVRAVGAVIRERGDVPFLHASATNVDAIRLYEHMDFTLRRTTVFWGWTVT